MSEDTEIENQPEWKIQAIKRDFASQLDWQEREISKHTKGICERFKEIHDRKLYRFTYESFEEYSMSRWNMSQAKAYRIIQAANSKEALLALCEDAPEIAKVVQSLPDSTLVVASSHKPAKVIKALRDMPGKPTASQLKERLSGAPKVANAKVITRCPHCNHEL